MQKTDYLANAKLKINSARRTEFTTYGAVQWNVTPTTHGDSFNMPVLYVLTPVFCLNAQSSKKYIIPFSSVHYKLFLIF